MSEHNESNGSKDQKLARGLVYVHDALGSNIVSVQEISAQVYALTETLISKGLISLHEVDKRRQNISQQMMADLPQKWLGARMLADQGNKYDAECEVKIDCENRVHLCKAACCKFGFYLSRQDLEEGIVDWDVGRPYHISQKENGYCKHHDEDGFRCTIRENRPLTCRGYDCRNDKRIWSDFEQKIPNPTLATLDTAHPGNVEAAP